MQFISPFALSDSTLSQFMLKDNFQVVIYYRYLHASFFFHCIYSTITISHFFWIIKEYIFIEKECTEESKNHENSHH